MSFVYLRSPPTFAAIVVFTVAQQYVIVDAADVVVEVADLEAPPPPASQRASTLQVREPFIARPILAPWFVHATVVVATYRKAGRALAIVFQQTFRVSLRRIRHIPKPVLSGAVPLRTRNAVRSIALGWQDGGIRACGGGGRKDATRSMGGGGEMSWPASAENIALENNDLSRRPSK